MHLNFNFQFVYMVLIRHIIKLHYHELEVQTKNILHKETCVICAECLNSWHKVENKWIGIWRKFNAGHGW